MGRVEKKPEPEPPSDAASEGDKIKRPARDFSQRAFDVVREATERHEDDDE